MALLPTGFGKSLICQILPTIYRIRKNRNRVVLVITPLNAIMKQQVEELCSRKTLDGLPIKAMILDDSEEGSARQIIEENIDVVFGSAEKWLSSKWREELLKGKLGQKVAVICVDEAHTVIEW